MTRRDRPEYRVWCAMRERCSNARNKSFKRYGGRGILVCDRWKQFDAFIADMGVRPSPEHQIDRIDVNGNYEPSNCRWVDRVTNNRNRTNNHFIEIGDRRQTISAWAEERGVSPLLIATRIRRGWNEIEAVMTAPANSMQKTNRCNSGHEMTLTNTYRRPDSNVRVCRTCARLRRNEYRRVHGRKS